jgi:hypothetical protein
LLNSYEAVRTSRCRHGCTTDSCFLAALERAPDQWPAFADEACGDQIELRARVQQLLHAHQTLGSIHDGLSGSRTATLDQAATEERPEATVGPFKLLQEIGEGGMGTVLMAEQSQPVRRKVALKIINPGMDRRPVQSPTPLAWQRSAPHQHECDPFRGRLSLVGFHYLPGAGPPGPFA